MHIDFWKSLYDLVMKIKITVFLNYITCVGISMVILISLYLDSWVIIQFEFSYAIYFV